MVRKRPQIGYEKYATFLDLFLGFPVLGKVRDHPRRSGSDDLHHILHKVREGWGARSFIVRYVE